MYVSIYLLYKSAAGCPTLSPIILQCLLFILLHFSVIAHTLDSSWDIWGVFHNIWVHFVALCNCFTVCCDCFLVFLFITGSARAILFICLAQL